MKLEDIKQKDREDIIKLTKLKSVMKYVGNGEVWDSDKVDRFIGYNLKEVGSKNRREYYYKITDNKFVGIIGVHPFQSFKGYYLSVMILPSEQRKGYYRKSIVQLSERIKKEGIKTDRIKILVRTNNKRMISLSEKNYYFNRERQIKGESFYEFFYFLRKLTYLVKTDYFNLTDVKNIFNERGIWRPFKEGKDKNPDFLHVDSIFSYDKRLYKYKSLLKNLLVNNDSTITNKDNLYENLSKIKGGKKYIVENYNINIEENKNKFKKLFDGETPWIVKPVGTGEGKGIEIVTYFEEFEDYFNHLDKYDIKEKAKKKFVLQKYITNPLLFKGRKFHMRYHMICYDGQFFPLKNIQVLTAKKKYTFNNWKDKEVHDTHYESSLKGIYFPHSFNLKKKEIEKINNQIIDMLTKCVSLVNFNCWDESKKCYHVFGADIMILDDLSVKILEINRKIGMEMGKETKYVNSDKPYNTHLFRQEMEFVVDNIFPPEKKKIS